MNESQGKLHEFIKIDTKFAISFVCEYLAHLNNNYFKSFEFYVDDWWVYIKCGFYNFVVFRSSPMTLGVRFKRILFEINTGRRIKLVSFAGFSTTYTKRIVTAVLWRRKKTTLRIAKSTYNDLFLNEQRIECKSESRVSFIPILQLSLNFVVFLLHSFSFSFFSWVWNDVIQRTKRIDE